MKLENQVISLELAKKLNRLGVEKDSYWMWVKYKMWKEPRVWSSDLASGLKMDCLSGKRERSYAAFTVAELGEMLPKNIYLEKKFYVIDYGIRISNVKRQWRVLLKGIEEHNIYNHFEEAKTEANARAKCLIFLIKEGIIKV